MTKQPASDGKVIFFCRNSRRKKITSSPDAVFFAFRFPSILLALFTLLSHVFRFSGASETMLVNRWSGEAASIFRSWVFLVMNGYHNKIISSSDAGSLAPLSVYYVPICWKFYGTRGPETTGFLTRVFFRATQYPFQDNISRINILYTPKEKIICSPDAGCLFSLSRTILN